MLCNEGMAGSRRNVIREHEFEEQLAELIPDAPEADEFTSAAEYVLADDPTIGVRVYAGPPEIWTLAMQPVRGRAVAMFYTFDAEAVIFLSILPFD